MSAFHPYDIRTTYNSAERSMHAIFFNNLLISGKNLFSDIMKQVNNVKDLVGPVYISKDMDHHYSEIMKESQNFL